MADHCRHELDPATCAVCSPRRRLPAAPARTMTARYDGRCPCCGGTIEAGATIGLVDDAWVCHRCLE
jgi:hypothetical protein